MISDKGWIVGGVGGSFIMLARSWAVLISRSVANECGMGTLSDIHYTMSAMRYWSVLYAMTL